MRKIGFRKTDNFNFMSETFRRSAKKMLTCDFLSSNFTGIKTTRRNNSKLESNCKSKNTRQVTQFIVNPKAASASKSRVHQR